MVGDHIINNTQQTKSQQFNTFFCSPLFAGAQCQGRIRVRVSVNFYPQLRLEDESLHCRGTSPPIVVHIQMSSQIPGDDIGLIFRTGH